MAEGTVKWFDPKKGYGFIEQDDGDDVFVHINQWCGPAGSEPREGDRVAFSVGPGRKPGEVEAKEVRPYGTEPVKPAQQTRKRPPSSRREDGAFLNPYNFVRALSKKRPKGHILGDCPPPPHDRYIPGLLTGCITCRVKAVTPLFVSDSHDVRGKVREHRSFRFFTYENEEGKKEPALPASSLRGMIRSVFEAVTNSCFAVLANKKLSKHIASGDANKLVPARVEEVDGRFMLRLLPGTNQADPNGLPPGAPQYAAWIKLYPPMRGSPTERANPNSLYAQRSLLALPRGIEHGSACTAIVERMQHPPRPIRERTVGQFDFWNVVHIAANRGALPVPRPGQEVVDGWLCVTNQNIENKHDERVFFIDGNARLLPLKDSVIKNYELLIQDYQERHKDAVEKRQNDGYAPGEPIPGSDKDAGFSRFVIDSRESHLEDGALVYAMLGGTQANPTVEFIAPVSIPRVGYGKGIGELLDTDVVPEESSRHKCRRYDRLCPACRVFGWVYGTGDPEEPKLRANERAAYAGRVRLTHARPVDDRVRQRKEPVTLAILSTPKPTTTPFYLMKNGAAVWDVDYDDPDAQLRGRKFYRHHGDEPSKHQGGKYEYEWVGGEPSDQNRTVRGVVESGSLFEFELEFENMHRLELGALLWALELEPKMCHRLGYGKPLGFGSVTIGVESLKVLRPDERYSDLSSDGWGDPPEDKDDLTKDFVKEMKRQDQYGEAFDQVLEELRDLLGVPPIPSIHYPREEAQPAEKGENFRWFVWNKGKYGPHEPLGLATQDDGLPLPPRGEQRRSRRR
jgi:CRISPR-associated protein (TIGR03986 family)